MIYSSASIESTAVSQLSWKPLLPELVPLFLLLNCDVIIILSLAGRVA